MIQIKALHTRTMCCFNLSTSQLPAGLKQEHIAPQTTKIPQQSKPTDPHFLRSEVMSIVIS